MTRLAHLSIPAPYSPDDAVAVWRALLVFLLLLGAVFLADRWDKRRERLNDGEERADARRRIRDFQETQAHQARRG